MSRGLFITASLVAVLLCAQALIAQEIIREFDAPGRQSRGLAWDGSYLWCSDSGTDRIYKVDPESGDTLFSFYFDMYSEFGGLTWDTDETLWIANGKYLYKLDPTTGEEVGSFHCPGG